MNRTTFATAATLTLMSGTLTSADAQPSSGHAHPSAPAASASHASAPGRWEWITHTGPAGERRYRLYVPSRHDGRTAIPLVVMLHGCTQDPDDFARGTRMNAVAEEMGFLVAYPEQTAALHPQKCWTWYDPAHQGRGGEPALVEAIAREVVARHRGDPERVYVAGVSAGAAMAVNAAAAYPETFAAAAAHSGIPYRAAGGVGDALLVMQGGASADGGPPPLADVRERAGRLPALLVVHGAADPVVRLPNGERLAAQWAGGLGVAPGAREDAAEGGLATHRTRFGAGDGAPVELLVVDGLGHAWSGGSAEGTYTDARGPDASRRIAAFLLKHRKTGGQ